MKQISTDTLGGRLRVIRIDFPGGKQSQKDIAESLGISEAQYKTYELNRVIPSDAILQLICMKYNADYMWLKYGEGSRPFLQPESIEKQLDQIMPQQSRVAKIIMAEACRVLDDNAWGKIGEMIRAVGERLKTEEATTEHQRISAIARQRADEAEAALKETQATTKARA